MRVNHVKGVRIDPIDGKIYLVLEGFVLHTDDGDVVIPEDADLKIELEPRHLVDLSSSLARLGYVRV